MARPAILMETAKRGIDSFEPVFSVVYAVYLEAIELLASAVHVFGPPAHEGSETENRMFASEFLHSFRYFFPDLHPIDEGTYTEC